MRLKIERTINIASGRKSLRLSTERGPRIVPRFADDPQAEIGHYYAECGDLRIAMPHDYSEEADPETTLIVVRDGKGNEIHVYARMYKD